MNNYSVGFQNQIKTKSKLQINKIHHLAKKIWKDKKCDPIELQNKCLESWSSLPFKTKIKPLISIDDESQVTNLIFGSGKFSTAEFQITQYNEVKKYCQASPINLDGIVTNKSKKHGCNAKEMCLKYNIPLIELDFIDWYHDNIDISETNPIRASSYWFQNDNQISNNELERRFNVRQNMFHKDLGDKIFSNLQDPIDIVSARGYNFQFCSNIFKHQNHLPHINDTHPADLTFVDPKTKEKLYAGWQSNAVQLMINDKQKLLRGSLIETECMDKPSQIQELDEGALLAIGTGVPIDLNSNSSAKELQSMLKIMDDYLFCTLEPTGLILTWGISEDPVEVTFSDRKGEEVKISQRMIVVGNKIKSGRNAWGANFDEDILELEKFLFT